jgi:hypothetical protein
MDGHLRSSSTNKIEKLPYDLFCVWYNVKPYKKGQQLIKHKFAK